MKEKSFEQKEIEEVIEKYTNMVYGIILTHLQNVSDAEDIFQEVFLTYYRKNIIFQGEEHKKAWLIKTTLLLCKKSYWKDKNKKTIPLEEIKEYSSPFLLKEENTVFEALCNLPEKYKIVFYLFYFVGMSTEEIAFALKIRSGTIRMRLSRGRKLLENKLEINTAYRKKEGFHG